MRSRADRIALCVAALAAGLAVSGCKSRDCSETQFLAATLGTDVSAASADNAYDYERYKDLLAEWRNLSRNSCKLPRARVVALGKAVEASYADKLQTPDEMAPVLAEMDAIVKEITGKSLVKEGVASSRAKRDPCAPADIEPLNLPMAEQALAVASPGAKQEAWDTDEKSITADANLRALLKAQHDYHASKKRFLTFKKGTAKTWKTLGLEFPAKVHHAFRASDEAGRLRILAQANLDGDPFLDRWLVEYETGGADKCPSPTVLAADAIDISFETGGMPKLMAKGEQQPFHPKIPKMR